MTRAASNGSPINGMNELHKHDQRFSLSPFPPSSYAQWHKVPRKSIVSVEHPFIVSNPDKGVASLGGPGKLQEVVLPLYLLGDISDSLSVDW